MNDEIGVPVSISFKDQIYGHVKDDLKMNVTDWAKAAFEFFLEVPTDIQKMLVIEQAGETRKGNASKVYDEKPPSVSVFSRQVRPLRPFVPPLSKLPKSKIS